MPILFDKTFNLNITQELGREIERAENWHDIYEGTNFCKDIKRQTCFSKYIQEQHDTGCGSAKMRNSINYFAKTSDNPEFRQVRHSTKHVRGFLSFSMMRYLLRVLLLTLSKLANHVGVLDEYPGNSMRIWCDVGNIWTNSLEEWQTF